MFWVFFVFVFLFLERYTLNFLIKWLILDTNHAFLECLSLDHCPRKYAQFLETKTTHVQSVQDALTAIYENENPDQPLLLCTVTGLCIVCLSAVPVLSGHSKIDKTKILMTNGTNASPKYRRMWSILQCF